MCYSIFYVSCVSYISCICLLHLLLASTPQAWPLPGPSVYLPSEEQLAERSLRRDQRTQVGLKGQTIGSLPPVSLLISHLHCPFSVTQGEWQ